MLIAALSILIVLDWDWEELYRKVYKVQDKFQVQILALWLLQLPIKFRKNESRYFQK